MKTCYSCKETKLFKDFWKGQYCCISCSKFKQKNSWSSRTPKKRLEQHLKYKYKTCLDDFFNMLDKQNGCCAICEELLPDLLKYENRKRGYAIDHNHETGEIRGVLCLMCNSLLGMAKDCPIILNRAQKYLMEKGNYNIRVAKKNGR